MARRCGCQLDLRHNSRRTRPKLRSRSQELRYRVHGRLIDELGSTLYDSDMPEHELKALVYGKLEVAVAEERVPLSMADKQRLIESIANDVLGYGPIDPLLHDESVTEIMVNGPDQVYVERAGKAGVAPVRFPRRGPPPSRDREDRCAGWSPHRRILPAL